jgi:serine/threonine protein kinase
MIGRSTKYVSPELVFKSTTIRDIRYNDIWKIGILVFTLLTG